MTDYLPTTNEVRGSLVFLNKHYAEQCADVDVDLLVVESETAAQFDRWLAEVERAAAARALEEVAAEIGALVSEYTATAERLSEGKEWADSNRYFGYASGSNRAAAIVRARAEEYRQERGEQ